MFIAVNTPLLRLRSEERHPFDPSRDRCAALPNGASVGLGSIRKLRKGPKFGTPRHYASTKGNA